MINRLGLSIHPQALSVADTARASEILHQFGMVFQPKQNRFITPINYRYITYKP